MELNEEGDVLSLTPGELADVIEAYMLKGDMESMIEIMVSAVEGIVLALRMAESQVMIEEMKEDIFRKEY